MKKVNLISLIIILSFSSIFLFISSNSTAKQERDILQEEFVPNEVLVRFKKDIHKYFIQDAINSIQGNIITYLGEEIISSDWDPGFSSLRSFRSDPYLLHIKVPDYIGTEQAIYLFGLNPNVEHVAKNIILHLDKTPLDTHFTKLWGLHNTGQTGGTVDADIDAPEAWDIFTGSSNVVVAVIDSGVDYYHDDLDLNIWQNPGETGNGKETDGIDNDNNGYKDDWRGWDFASNDNKPMDEDEAYYHGTHIAGTIGAIGDNDNGVTGINWNVEIMALRVTKLDGDIPVSNVISAIDYATENGAHLSSNSYGWRPSDADWFFNRSYLYQAINRAKQAGKLFIASAGNDEWNLDDPENPNRKKYPACYSLDNIISVAATDHNDSKAGYTNYGIISVDLGAPGGGGESYPDFDYKDIYSTKRYDNYQYMAGTSMAAPHVAGVAALVWGYKPNLSWSDVKSIILDNVDVLDSLSGKVVSNGRLNAYKALKEFFPPDAPSNLNGAPRAWSQIKLWWQDNSDNEDGFKIERKTSSSAYSQIGTTGENITSYKDNTVSAGITYYYRVRAYNNRGGNSSFSNIATATIPTDPPDAPEPEWADYDSGEVCFTWSDLSNNEQGFEIERKSEWDPFWEERGSVGPNETKFYDNNLEPDTIYYYRVRAYNPYGYSPYIPPPVEVYVPWH